MDSKQDANREMASSTLRMFVSFEFYLVACSTVMDMCLFYRGGRSVENNLRWQGHSQ